MVKSNSSPAKKGSRYSLALQFVAENMSRIGVPTTYSVTFDCDNCSQSDSKLRNLKKDDIIQLQCSRCHRGGTVHLDETRWAKMYGDNHLDYYRVAFFSCDGFVPSHFQAPDLWSCITSRETGRQEVMVADGRSVVVGPGLKAGVKMGEFRLREEPQ